MTDKDFLNSMRITPCRFTADDNDARLAARVKALTAEDEDEDDYRDAEIQRGRIREAVYAANLRLMSESRDHWKTMALVMTASTAGFIIMDFWSGIR